MREAGFLDVALSYGPLSFHGWFATAGTVLMLRTDDDDVGRLAEDRIGSTSPPVPRRRILNLGRETPP